MFGKALGNGHAITAVIGRREVMEAAQTSFISSTFWTERIGPTSARKTLEVMSNCQSWDLITTTVLKITKRQKDMAAIYGLAITTADLPSQTNFTITSANDLADRTLTTQEMLSNGFLASNSVYVCREHTPEIGDEYFANLDLVFQTLRVCEDERDIGTLLKGPVCDSGFRRLN